MSRRARRNRNRKLIAGGIAVIAAFCVFALVIWPAVSAEPVIAVKGNAEIDVEYNAAYEDSGAAATLRRKDISGDITTSGDVDTSKVGTYEIDYTVNYRKKTYTQKRVVHVVDTTVPAIKLKGKDEVTVPDIESYDEPGYSAEDNYDGKLTDKVETSMEKKDDDSYVVSYRVADSSGNEAVVQRKILIKKGESADYGGNPKNAVYLTFDDGPSTDVTTRILDILKKNNVQATFFICNYSEDKVDLLKRMVAEGHTIGIHGYSHEYKDIYKSTDAFMENLNKLRDKLKKDTGYDAFCMRFPGGSSNTISANFKKGIMTKLAKLVEQEGWAYYDWNVDSTDAEGNNRDKNILIRNATRYLKKNRSNVVLMHDISTKRTTADALQSIISYGKKNGYAFYPISEDTIPIHHGINN